MTRTASYRLRAAQLLGLLALLVSVVLIAAACGTSASDAEAPADVAEEESDEAVEFEEADPTEEEFEEAAGSDLAELESVLSEGVETIEVRIAYLSCGVGEAYCDATLEGIEKSASEANATVTVIDAMGDAETQVAQLEQAAGSGDFDGLIVTPLDPGTVVSGVEAAVAAGLPIACTRNPCGADLLDLELQIEGQTLYVGSSPIINGTALGGAVLDACFDRPSCNAAFIGDGLDTPVEATRLQGFEEITLDFGEVTIVAREEGGGTADAALAATTAILEANPMLDIVAATSDEMALGVERAIEEAGRAGEVLVVGNGASEIGHEAVAGGRWYASVVYLPVTEGEIAGDAVTLAASDEDIGWPPYVEILDLSDVGEYLIADFAADFTPEWSGAAASNGAASSDG